MDLVEIYSPKVEMYYKTKLCSQYIFIIYVNVLFTAFHHRAIEFDNRIL